jgi:hypothetical protein
MRVCLMIEGQEDVRWEHWRALAAACENHDFDALLPRITTCFCRFRSSQTYISG